jgi:multidrug efflux pump subunit AcrB
MIGFIALAGIEVRNSILMVDFTKNELEHGQPIEKAVVNAGHIRFRPIWVTDLTMMAGSFALIFDPIFQGMAISLLFGPVVSTSLTLLVVPLGCLSARRSFARELQAKAIPLAENDRGTILPAADNAGSTKVLPTSRT